MTPLRTTFVVLALPLAAVALVGCGSHASTSTATTSAPSNTFAPTTTRASAAGSSGTSSTTAPTPTAPGHVTIADYDFSPNSITVAVGETVTWTNQDTADHWVVSAPSSPGAFDLGRQRTGTSVTHTFTAPGTYPYFCNLHNYMKGTVVVR